MCFHLYLLKGLSKQCRRRGNTFRDWQVGWTFQCAGMLCFIVINIIVIAIIRHASSITLGKTALHKLQRGRSRIRCDINFSCLQPKLSSFLSELLVLSISWFQIDISYLRYQLTQCSHVQSSVPVRGSISMESSLSSILSLSQSLSLSSQTMQVIILEQSWCWQRR